MYRTHNVLICDQNVGSYCISTDSNTIGRVPAPYSVDVDVVQVDPRLSPQLDLRSTYLNNENCSKARLISLLQIEDLVLFGRYPRTQIPNLPCKKTSWEKTSVNASSERESCHPSSSILAKLTMATKFWTLRWTGS